MSKIKDIFFPKHILRMLLKRDDIKVTGRIVAVKTNTLTGKVTRIHGVNIVTTKGDKFYAQSANGETPTDAFKGANSGLRLGTAATAPTKSSGDVTTFLAGSGHAVDSGYPKTNDNDANNTGAGVAVLSWRYSYLTSEGNGTGIAEGALVDNKTTPTGALSHFLFAAPFDKTNADTLAITVNHAFLGV